MAKHTRVLMIVIYIAVSRIKSSKESARACKDIEDEILRLLSAEGDILESKEFYSSMSLTQQLISRYIKSVIRFIKLFESPGTRDTTYLLIFAGADRHTWVLQEDLRGDQQGGPLGTPRGHRGLNGHFNVGIIKPKRHSAAMEVFDYQSHQRVEDSSMVGVYI